MKGIIVGGGIGGLTLGVALHQAGVDATVYEAVPEIKPVGAGILLGTNAMQLVYDNGIFFEFVPFNEENFDGDGKIKNNPRALTINEVEENVNYAILITTCSGAWRYLIFWDFWARLLISFHLRHLHSAPQQSAS